MGFPKPLLKIGERTFIEHVASTMLSVVPRLVVVLGAHADRIRPSVPHDPRIRMVFNPDYERGQLSSLKVAIRSLEASADAALIHLADHPTVTQQTFQTLVEAWTRGKKPILIARYGSRRGHPVMFDRSMYQELLDAPESVGARFVVNADPGRVHYIETDDPGVVLDLDTPQDVIRAGLAPPPSTL